MMFLSYYTILSFIAVTARVWANDDEEAVAPDSSKVVKVDRTEFLEYMENESLFLTEFFAPWCGHCKKLGPEFVKAADELSENSIPLLQFNCDEDKEFCRELGIPGFPTLKVYKNGNAKDYTGARSAEAIIQTMLKQTLPNVSIVETEYDLLEFVKDVKLPVIVNANTTFNETFYKLADQLEDDFVFISLNETGKYISKDQLVLYAAEAEELTTPFVYDFTNIDESLDNLLDWIRYQSLPYFGEITGETFQAYMEAKLPLAYFFYTSKEERDSYLKLFNKLGQKYRGVLNFVGLDSTKFGRHAENLNMKEQFPLFVIHNITSNYKYGLPQLPERKFAALKKPYTIKEKDITKFVESFLNGKVDPVIKSEPVPETQETNVTKLVAFTHDDVVNDPKKDVFVKYYAPWCGHCKKMAPTYLELADIYAFDKDSADKIVIAEVDGTLNDISSVQLEGFPTLILYPAGKDAEPITYSGSRSLESMLEFIHKNGMNDIDGTSIYESYEAAKFEEDKGVEDEIDSQHDEL